MTSKGSLHGKAVLVAGGSGSIGRAVCKAVLAQGGTILLHGRTEASARAAAEGIGRSAHNRSEVLWGDLTMPGETERVVALAHEQSGRLDGIVNCVVGGPPGVTGPFSATQPGAYSGFLHASVTQAQWLLHAGVTAMEGGGSFVTLVSDAGLFAARSQSLIASSRAAIIGFCRNAALDLAKAAIRVNCVSTTYVVDSATGLRLAEMENPRMARAAKRAGLGLPTCSDVADLCVFLLGPASARLTGQVISVNGGLNA